MVAKQAKLTAIFCIYPDWPHATAIFLNILFFISNVVYVVILETMLDSFPRISKEICMYLKIRNINDYILLFRGNTNTGLLAGP